jgi:alanyl-tRNA synthetase
LSAVVWLCLLTPAYIYQVVEIPGVDFNKCCGTHLASTGEIQLVLFSKVDRVKGNFRLHFLAGACLRTSTPSTPLLFLLLLYA